MPELSPDLLSPEPTRGASRRQRPTDARFRLPTHVGSVESAGDDHSAADSAARDQSRKSVCRPVEQTASGPRELRERRRDAVGAPDGDVPAGASVSPH